MIGNDAVQETPIVSRDRAIEVIRRELHTATVVERRMTVDQIAAASGLKVGTVRSYMRNEDARETCLSSALSIAVVLGPRAVSAVVTLIGYVARPLDDADQIQPMVLAASAMSDLAIIANAAADGRIDHVEQPLCRAASDRLIATVLPLSSHASAA